MLHIKLERFLIWWTIGFLLLIARISPSVAQENPLPTELIEELPLNEAIPSHTEIYLGIIVLVFGSLLIILQYISLKQAKASPETIMMSFIINSIIISSLYLVTLGLDDNQIAPAFSLYGAIIGYLLGKEVSRRQFKEGGTKDD